MEFLCEAGFTTARRCTGAGDILGETEAGVVVGVERVEDRESLSTFSRASSTVSTCGNIVLGLLGSKLTTFSAP